MESTTYPLLYFCILITRDPDNKFKALMDIARRLILGLRSCRAVTNEEILNRINRENPTVNL